MFWNTPKNYRVLQVQRLAARCVFAVWLAMSVNTARADDLLVTNASMMFTLDLRLSPGSLTPTSMVVVAESPPFTLDTRLSTASTISGLVVSAVSAAFPLDTRLSEAAPVGSIASASSGAFTLDTRLSLSGNVTGIVISAVSPAFALDTRLSSSVSMTGVIVSAVCGPFVLDTRLSSALTTSGLVVSAVSPAFVLDLRLSIQNPLFSSFIARAVSDTFTLDARLVTTAFAALNRFDDFGTGGKVRFSPNGLLLAKADGSRVLQWNLQTSRPGSTYIGNNGTVVSLGFAPLGDQLLTGSADGTTRWWDSSSRSNLGSLTLSGTVYTAWSVDGSRLLAGSGTGLKLYTFPSTNLLQILTNVTETITGVALSPDGTRAVAATSTKAVLVWNALTGQFLWRLAGHGGLINAVSFLPNGTNVMSASTDGTIRIWSTTHGTESLRITQGSPVDDAAVSADGRFIISCDTSNPGHVYAWDAMSGALARVFAPNVQIKGVALSPDNTMLATAITDGSVMLWDTGLTPNPTQSIAPLGFGSNAPVTLRSHGLYYFEINAEPGRSLVVTLQTNASGSSFVPASKNAGGQSPAALSPDAAFANLGGAATHSVAAKSLQAPPNNVDVAGFRMTAHLGRLPSEYEYQFFAQAPVTNLHCEMPVATGQSNKVYVLVFAPYLAAGSISARIRAEYSEFHLSSIVPAQGGNSGNVTAKLLGTGITPDTSARLFNGSASIPGQLAMWGDSTKAWFTFPLSNAAVGVYHVEMQKPGSAPTVVNNAFQVAAGVGPQLQSQLTAPSAVRSRRNYGMTLSFANAGDVDMAAPLFVVSTALRQPWLFVSRDPNLLNGTLDPSQSQKVGELQFLGLNSEGPPGILPPGASMERTLYFQGDGGVADMSFNLEVLRADSTPIDWNSLEANFRPPDMAADLWAALWSNFQAVMGGTWAEYLRALDTQAHLLALSGQSSSDVGDLLAAAFSQAIGTSYRRTLAAGLDAQAPAPALPLRFSRFATDGLEHRFALGPLGRGWSHNFEYSFTRPTNGVVFIRSPGGGARRFTLGSGDVWRGGTGDYASLNVEGGGFALREKEGIAWHFDAGGQLASIDEPNGNTITLSYSSGRLSELSHSAGTSFALGYSAEGRLSQLTDHAGQITTYEYDGSGEHLLHVISPGQVTNSFSYLATNGPANHALTSITAPDHTHQYFEWDARGRLVGQSRDGDTERLQYTYDAAGYLSTRDANNAVVTMRLGDRGQLLQMTDPLAHQVTMNYDTNFNLTRLIGPVGDTTEMGYDAQGNATAVANPLSQVVNLNYGSLNRLDTLRDARNQLTDFGYDAQGNLTNIAYTDTSAEVFGYDSTGNVTTFRNRRGQTIQLTRNALGQLTHKAFPEGRTIDYQYDARGFLTNVTDSAQGTTRMAFDDRGHMTGITYPDGKGFTFEYTTGGRRTRRIGHDGYTLNYDYDAVGRLHSLSNGTGGLLVLYSYDAAGRLVREDKGNGTFTTYAYDPAGQTVALTNCAPNGTAQSFFNYAYDAKGNRLAMITAAGVTSYGYDGINQLTSVSYPGGRSVTYAYDAAGNRTVVGENGSNTVYTANALNQYTQAGGTTFGYDADGNLTSRSDATGLTTYQFDSENRLLQVVTPTNGTWQYSYDAFGNRVAVVHDGVTNRFLHDPVGLVDVAAEYDAGGTLVARYNHALGLVARTDGGGNSAFYDFDALGNTRELTGNGGAVLNSYDYDAFGAETGTSESVANAFRFVGRFGVTGYGNELSLMRRRYYSTASGRFLTPDPIRFEGGINLLSYVGNNPVGFIDPSGLFWDNFSIDVSGGWHLPIAPLAQFGGSWSSSWNGNFGRSASWTDNGWQSEVQFGGIADVGVSVGASWGKPDVTFTFAPGSVLGAGVGPNVYVSFDGGKFVGFGVGVSADIGLPFTATFPVLPDGATTSVGDGVHVPVVRPRDPNDKIAPPGVGPNRVVSAQDEMEYMIRFENFATASAPVQELIVVDYLDAGLDWTTVKIKEIGYGDRIITPTTNQQNFLIRDRPPTNSTTIIGAAVGDMVVDAFGSFNPQIGRLECRLTAIDTNTSYFPLDALSGFLPPEDGTGRGNGYVRFSVKPKTNVPIGTGITNIANIIFDGNDAINTPEVWNLIGDVPSLATTIAYLPGVITVGTPTTYTVGLTNTGGTNITNVFLTNALPDGVNILSATANYGTVTITNGLIIWDLGTITNGFGGTLTVTLLPTQAGTFSNNLFYTGGSGLAIYSPSTPLVVVPAVPPTLTIRLTDGQTELSWPANATGFVLETSTNLSPTASWSAVTSTPAILGDQNFVTNSATGSERFYRLRK